MHLLHCRLSVSFLLCTRVSISSAWSFRMILKLLQWEIQILSEIKGLCTLHTWITTGTRWMLKTLGWRSMYTWWTLRLLISIELLNNIHLLVFWHARISWMTLRILPVLMMWQLRIRALLQEMLLLVVQIWVWNHVVWVSCQLMVIWSKLCLGSSKTRISTCATQLWKVLSIVAGHSTSCVGVDATAHLPLSWNSLELAVIGIRHQFVLLVWWFRQEFLLCWASSVYTWFYSEAWTLCIDVVVDVVVANAVATDLLMWFYEWVGAVGDQGSAVSGIALSGCCASSNASEFILKKSRRFSNSGSWCVGAIGSSSKSCFIWREVHLWLRWTLKKWSCCSTTSSQIRLISCESLFDCLLWWISILARICQSSGKITLIC